MIDIQSLHCHTVFSKLYSIILIVKCDDEVSHEGIPKNNLLSVSDFVDGTCAQGLIHIGLWVTNQVPLWWDCGVDVAKHYLQWLHVWSKLRTSSLIGEAGITVWTVP